MADCITIDGSQGEGGGQILRTSLALSLVTGQPFRITGIRAGRRKPGLLRQHLTAVQASVAVGRARVDGAELGSREVSFAPAGVRGGDYRFAIGTAGSVTLVLQAILPALLQAPEASRLTLEGGTHNPYAPPFEFLAKALLPLLRRMGVGVDARLEAYGFYPAGGGRLTVTVEPSPRLTAVHLSERGDTRVTARALLSALPDVIATRELGIVRQRLGLAREVCRTEHVHAAVGPGNLLAIIAESPEITEVFSGFGEKGVSAERVAVGACDEAAAYLAAGVPVGSHLADQLVVPMALARGGSFRTLAPTAHTTTNIAVIRQFLDVPIAIDEESKTTCRISVG